jgi:hypothetical protein
MASRILGAGEKVVGGRDIGFGGKLPENLTGQPTSGLQNGLQRLGLHESKKKALRNSLSRKAFRGWVRGLEPTTPRSTGFLPKESVRFRLAPWQLAAVFFNTVVLERPVAEPSLS